MASRWKNANSPTTNARPRASAKVCLCSTNGLASISLKPCTATSMALRWAWPTSAVAASAMTSFASLVWAFRYPPAMLWPAQPVRKDTRTNILKRPVSAIAPMTDDCSTDTTAASSFLCTPCREKWWLSADAHFPPTRKWQSMSTPRNPKSIIRATNSMASILPSTP